MSHRIWNNFQTLQDKKLNHGYVIVEQLVKCLWMRSKPAYTKRILEYWLDSKEHSDYHIVVAIYSNSIVSIKAREENSNYSKTKKTRINECINECLLLWKICPKCIHVKRAHVVGFFLHIWLNLKRERERERESWWGRRCWLWGGFIYKLCSWEKNLVDVTFTNML